MKGNYLFYDSVAASMGSLSARISVKTPQENQRISKNSKVSNLFSPQGIHAGIHGSKALIN